MGLFSGIDFGAFAAGAADQYVENVEKKNDYYRDLMTKQEDYMMRYGRKTVNDRTSMANSAVEMLDSLEAGGLDSKSAEELVSKYGYQGVSALKKLQEQFETQYDGATLDLNAVFKGSEDYVRQEGYDIDQALKDQFLVEVAKADTGAGDVASDAEDRGFLASLGDMFAGGGQAKERYEASRTTPSIAGYSYNDILAMEGMGMPASRGLPTFDRSALADPDAGKLGITEQRAYKSMYETKIVSAIGSQYFLEGMGNVAYDTANDSAKVAYAMSKNPEKVAEVMQGLYGQYGIEGNNLLLSTLQGIDITPETEEEKTIKLVEQGAEYGLSPDDIGNLEVINKPNASEAENNAAIREWFAANPDAEHVIWNGYIFPYEAPTTPVVDPAALTPPAGESTSELTSPSETKPDIMVPRGADMTREEYIELVKKAMKDYKVPESNKDDLSDAVTNAGAETRKAVLGFTETVVPSVRQSGEWVGFALSEGIEQVVKFFSGLFGYDDQNAAIKWWEQASDATKRKAIRDAEWVLLKMQNDELLQADIEDTANTLGFDIDLGVEPQ